MKYTFVFAIVFGYTIQTSYSGLFYDDIAPDVPQTEIWAVQSNTRNAMNGIFLGGIMKHFNEYKEEYKKCYENFVKRYQLVASVLAMNMKQCGETINKDLPVRYLDKVNHLRAELKSLAKSAVEFGEQLEKMVKKGKFENVKQSKEKWSEWGYNKYMNFYGDMLYIRKNTQHKAEELIKYVTSFTDEASKFAWIEAQGFEKCINAVDYETNAIE